MRIQGILVAGALSALTSILLVNSSVVHAQSGNVDMAKMSSSKIVYPAAKTVDQVDDYHGTRVADPYRWLEDPDSADSRTWIDAENQLTFAYLEKIPQRPAIRERLTRLWNFERYGVPFKEGGRYFYFKNDGLQNQSVLYTTPSIGTQAAVLIDPNTLSTDGTVALTDTTPSPDGKLLAYGIAASGSDWNEFKVRDIASGKDLEDHLKWIKFSGASWSRDSKGFFYSRYDEPNEATKLEDANYFQKLYYHAIGTDQSADVLVYERKDHKDWGFGGTVSEDGKYLIISVTQGTENKNRVYYLDLARFPADRQVVELLDDFDAAYNYIGNVGPVFWFFTTSNAPRGRVIAVDTSAPARANWKLVVSESTDTIDSVSLVNRLLVVSYLRDARGQVKVFRPDGTAVGDVALPGIGSVAGFTGRSTDTETFYSFTSYTTPTTIYHLDLSNLSSSVFKRPKVDFDPDAFEVEQVFVTSKDGTRLPMFITHRKGLKLDGTNPTILYGYGGFNISLTPSFSVTTLVWMEMGGVFAVPNLRGGGEYGEAWHIAGTRLQKQNVFDDFIASAEWLIAHKYTSTPKLAISGGSNGGLLVGAALTQRPDLFGAALPAVGVMDMLRFQKFTIGWAWTSDYGSSDNADDFKAIYKYSPLHNIKPGARYPATLVTTADHDDRVVPAHSFKFAATLQAAQAGPAPVLIRIETKAGHGAGKPTTKIIDEAADKTAFLVKELGVTTK